MEKHKITIQTINVPNEEAQYLITWDKQGKQKDVINIECLNRYLDKVGEYIIIGIQHKKCVYLMTNKLSLIASSKCEMCKKCRKKWEREIYAEGEICGCIEENKKMHSLLYLEGKNRTDGITEIELGILKKVFIEHFRVVEPEKIYMSKHKRDIKWICNLHEFLIDSINNDSREKLIRTYKDEMSLLKIQLRKTQEDLNGVTEKYVALSNEVAQRAKSIRELNGSIHDLSTTQTVNKQIIARLQNENDQLRKRIKEIVELSK